MSDGNYSSEGWLRDNQSLRMDANEDIFPEDRRTFHLARYQFAAEYCVDKTVLDGACGTGYGSALVAEVARQVTGIDFDAKTLQYARHRYGLEKIEFRQSFVEFTPFPSDSFDVVLSFETVEHTLCPNAHIKEIARLLCPTPRCAIVSIPNKWGYTDHHFFDFDFQMLKQILEPHFQTIEYYSQTPSAGENTRKSISPLTDASIDSAQCIIAVCRQPIKSDSAHTERLSSSMEEIYQNAFARHNEFRALLYRQNTPLWRRMFNRLRAEIKKRG